MYAMKTTWTKPQGKVNAHQSARIEKTGVTGTPLRYLYRLYIPVKVPHENSHMSTPPQELLQQEV
jgi:hypothetical protein